MGEKFFDPSHVRQKLNNTVCMYQGRPVYVDASLGSDMVRCYWLGDVRAAEPFNVNHTHPEFNYSEIPLGYCQYKRNAYYLSREPQRINQQGLTARAIISEPSTHIDGTPFLLSKSFRDCILGDHMSFTEAITRLKEDRYDSCAISRHVAVSKISNSIFIVNYRGKAVGVSENKGESFRVSAGKSTHLIDKRLQKAGVPLD